MLTYLVLIFSSFLAIFLLRWQRKHLYSIAEKAVGLLNDLLAQEEDDDAKIALIQKSTTQLVKALLIVVFLFAAALGIAFAPMIFVFDSGPKAISSLWGVISISLGASIPFFIPLKKTGNYSELSKLLHRLILNNYTLHLWLFKREIKKVKNVEEGFVVVSGLARAGTTSFMNHLAADRRFASLSYANMPLLLSPKLWSKLYKPKSTELQERSHKDGIKIGLNSNEALEEYFFKAHTKDDFIKDDCLTEHLLDAEQYRNYRKYQELVKSSASQIYLAKNNNFLLRYESMRRHNSQFLFIILFRNPLVHAASLLEKHKQYCQLQNDDPFVLEYMDWLGHHEFGLNQKPFGFQNQSEMLPEGDRGELNYWLQSWINYYQKAMKAAHANTLFINYEDYCKSPNEAVRKIYEKLKLNPPDHERGSFANNRKIQMDYGKSLHTKAQEIYGQLLSLTKGD